MQIVQKKEIPGPKGKPIIGVGLEFRKEPLEYLRILHETYGDIVKAKLGKNNVIFLFNPEYIKHVLATNNTNYHKSNNYKYLKEVLGEGLVTIEDDTWRRHRQIIQPVFHTNQLLGYINDFTALTSEFLKKWSSMDVINNFTEMSALTATIVTKTILGSDIALDPSAIGGSVSFLTLHIQNQVQSLITIPRTIPTPENRKFTKNMDYINTIVESIIEKHKQSPKDQNDVLSRLLGAKNPDSDEQLTDNELRDEIRTFFLAGHETTATSLTWANYLLAKNTSVRDKMIKEIHTIVGKERDPTYEDLQKMDYMDQVVNEVLRLYPAIYIFSRTPLKEDSIDDYTIPVGSNIIISQYVTHKDPLLWDKPEQFMPERFEEEKFKKIHKYAFIPFGGGPRMCIGKNFATLEMKIILAKIYQNNILELQDDEEVKPKPHFTLRPERDIIFKVITQKT